MQERPKGCWNAYLGNGCFGNSQGRCLKHKRRYTKGGGISSFRWPNNYYKERHHGRVYAYIWSFSHFKSSILSFKNEFNTSPKPSPGSKCCPQHSGFTVLLHSCWWIVAQLPSQWDLSILYLASCHPISCKLKLRLLQSLTFQTNGSVAGLVQVVLHNKLHRLSSTHSTCGLSFSFVHW